MTKMKLSFLPQDRPALVGMLHLLPLPASPRYGGSLDAVRTRLLEDAEALAHGGADAMIIENFGDTPFYPDNVPAHVIATMTALACDVRRRVNLPLGINVLRNDGCGAMAVAAASGAQFIRVNVMCGARVCDQGVINSRAHDIARLRQQLAAQRVAILADAHVKHSSPLGAETTLEDEVRELVQRSGADGVIVSGSATGSATAAADVQRAASAAGDAPIFVGSGVTAENINQFLPHARGVIVGTSVKQDGKVDAPVDANRVRALTKAIQASM